MAGNAAVHVKDCLLIYRATHCIILQSQIGPPSGALRHSRGKHYGYLGCEAGKS